MEAAKGRFLAEGLSAAAAQKQQQQQQQQQQIETAAELLQRSAAVCNAIAGAGELPGEYTEEMRKGKCKSRV